VCQPEWIWTLAAIGVLEGKKVVEEVALGCEYDWHRDSTWDPFAAKHNLI